MWTRCLTLSLLIFSLAGCQTSGLLSQVGRQIVQEIAPNLLPPPKADVEVQSSDGSWCRVMKELRIPDPSMRAGDLGPTARPPWVRILVYGEGNCPGWN